MERFQRLARNISLFVSLLAWGMLFASDLTQDPTANAIYPLPWHTLAQMRKETPVPSTDTSAPYKTPISFLNHESGQVITWGPSGYYDATITIDRYFGTETEIKKMSSLGIMDKTATLYIPCYDCDSSLTNASDEDVAPERDLVYLNGHYVGTLQGADETVIMNSFEIPLEYLNFPKYPGSKANNHLTIMVDTANSKKVWYLGQLWQMLVIDAPPPILLVHGWTTQQDTLAEFSHSLSRILGIPSTLVDVSADNSPYVNAEQLQADLERLTDQWGVNQFNIIAHSKGGLDSRVLIDANGFASAYVFKLFQVATPNLGSLFADVALNPIGKKQKAYAWAAAHFENATETSPSFTSLTVENCRRFNAQYNSPQSPIHTITGRVDTKDLSPSYRTLAKFVKLPDANDGMVTVGSAHALGTNIATSPLYESGTAKYDHSGIVRDGAPDVIRTLTERLQEKPDTPHSLPPYGEMTFATRSEQASNTDPASPQPSLNATSESDTIILEKGRIYEHEITLLTGNDAIIGILPCSPVTSAEILFPDDNIPLPMSAEALPPIVAENAEILTADLHDVQPGIYRIRIDCTAATRDALAKIIVKEEESFVVEIQAETTIPPSPEPIISSSCTYHGMQISGDDLFFTLRATKSHGANTTPLEFVMHDDGLNGDEIAGDGFFSCLFHPPEFGFWNLEAEVTGVFEGFPFSRSATTQVAISDAVGSIDIPLTEKSSFPLGSLRLPEFTFHTDVRVSQPGRYAISAEMVNPNGTIVARASTQWLSKTPETHSCDLGFPTDKLIALREDGPWTVQNLRLSLIGDQDSFAPPITLDQPIFTQNTTRTTFSEIVKYDFSIRLPGTGTEKVLSDTKSLSRILEVRMDAEVIGTPPTTMDFLLRVFPTKGTCVGFAKGELVHSDNGYQLVAFLDSEAIQSLEERNSFDIKDCTAEFFDENGFKHEIYIPGDYQTQEYPCSIFHFPTDSTLVTPYSGLEIELDDTPDDSGNYKARIRYTAPDNSDAPTESEDGASFHQQDTYYVCIPYVPLGYIQLENSFLERELPYQGEHLNVTDSAYHQLQRIGNQDGLLDPGETLEFTFVFRHTGAWYEEYDVADNLALRIFSYAPKEEDASYELVLHPFDTNGNLAISRKELEEGKNIWLKDEAHPQTLLEAMELSNAKGYLYDSESRRFFPTNE